MMDKAEILAKVKALESLARTLDPDKMQRSEISRSVLNYAEGYLDQLPNRLTYDQPDVQSQGPFPIEEEPAGIDGILEIIQNQVDSQGINPASGGHLGYIPGGGLVPAAWGDFLADISNRYAGIYFASPGGVKMENTLVRWLCDLIGYDDRAGGTLTSGGSLANLTAVVNARDYHKIGPKEVAQSVIYVTGQLHHCATKALHIAGLSECPVREVPMQNFRMDPIQLSHLIEEDIALGLTPFMVMASAGTTEAGVVDPLDEIARVTKSYDIWYHIDAAYGGFFLLTSYGKNIMKGIASADSVIIDPHKGMFLPYGSGALLVKDQRKLYDSQHYFASYMQDAVLTAEEMSPADLSPELSRHFRGMRMWLPLRLFGVKAFRSALEEKLWLARYFYQQLAQWDHIELGPVPELSVTFFRYLPPTGDIDEINRQLVASIQDDGRVFFSSTTLNGRFYLRLAVLNFRTHLEQINLALDILKAKIKAL